MVADAASKDALPRRRPELCVRWLVLALLCIGLVGSYFVYDEPAALNLMMRYYFTGYLKPGEVAPGPVLPESERISFDEYQNLFSWLYSAYSWPNVILPLIGGILSDRLGLRLGNTIFAGLVLLGQCVFALGMTLEGTQTRWAVMITGRVIFGLGGESLSVTMSGLIAKWFAGKELALALGLNLALARLGSVFNDAASPAIAEASSLSLSLWSGAGICAASFACAVAVLIIDRRSAALLRQNRREMRRHGDGTFGDRLVIGGGGGGKAGEAGALLDAAASPSVGAATALEDADGAAEDEQVNLSAVCRLPLTLWILTVSCVTTYCAILPFNNVAADFIVTRWPSVSAKTANYYMAVTYTTAGLISPFLGALIDRIGLRAVFCLVAACVITGVHLLLGLTTADPIVGLVFMGIAYSFYAAALWPSIALVVDEEIVGTAYGLTTAAQNLGLASVPLVIARMQVLCPETYECVSIAFAALAGCGIVSGVVLHFVNAAADLPVLNLPEHKIRVLRDAAEAKAAAGDTYRAGTPHGTPQTPLLEEGAAPGESITGLSLPPAGLRSASMTDAAGLTVGGGERLVGDSPDMGPRGRGGLSRRADEE